MVTKKRRRSQLAKAGAQRQQLRRAVQNRRRRRVRAVLAVTVVGLLVAALVTWIVMHPQDSGPTASARGDYASVLDQSHHPATTAEGAR